MANFYATETHTLQAVLKNPNPIDTPVTFQAHLTNALTGVISLSTIISSGIVPANGNLTVNFPFAMTRLAGAQIPWVQVWDTAGNLLAQGQFETANIYAAAIVVTSVWI